ncbi:hypothetical protein ACH5RR_011290 [Cinchona calisaya]|uniref:Uncharacterized protein n=1 Tax=Cinchona calisaya TaxID=153742 RepID=A0ABD3A4G7_9GENT
MCCRIKSCEEKRSKDTDEGQWVLNLKDLGERKVEIRTGLKMFTARMRLWIMRPIKTLLLIWLCVVQLTEMGNVWGPRLLNSWPFCFTPAEKYPEVEITSLQSKVILPPKSE